MANLLPELQTIQGGQAAQLQEQPKVNLLAELQQRQQPAPVQEVPADTGIFATPEEEQAEKIGQLEVAGALASGAVAAPISGIAGIVGGLLPGEPGQAARFQEATQEALTFQPRTEAGKEQLQSVAEAAEFIGEQLTRVPAGLAGLAQLPTEGVAGAAQTIESIQEQGLGESLGSATLEATGSPFLATLAASAPEASLELLGFKGANAVKGSKQITGITDDVEKTLARENISVDDLSPENVANIQNAVKQDLTDQIERAEFLREQGIEPTRAQITRDAGDFQTQQEIAKQPGKVRDALEGQEALIINRFDESIAGTGGQPVTSGSSVTDTVINRSTELDNEISDLYNRAREIAPGEKNVRMSELAALLKKKAPSDTATQGLIRSIKGDLQARGIIDDNFKVTGRVDVDTSEEVRKFINTHFDSTSDLGKGFMREFKDALDADTLKAAGEDVFNQARKAKAKFESDLNRAKINKFDKRKTSLVRDVLENKIDPDKLAEQVTSGGKYRAEDLNQLKTYLTKTGTPEQRKVGVQAWNDLRAETLNSIKAKAFIGPEDAAGNKTLSRAALETALKKVGNSRLNTMFSKQEKKFLDDILRVSKLREPVRGTALGRGPSAQAIERLNSRLDNLGIIKSLIQKIALDRQGKVVLTAKPKKSPKIQVLEGKAPGLATAATISSIIEQKEAQ